MMITYNNIIKKLDLIAGHHKFIRRFGSGQITEIDAVISDSPLFPMMWAIPQQADVEENTLTYTIRLMVFDINSIDDSKEQEILSDNLQTLTDVLKVLRYGDSTFAGIDLANELWDYNLEYPVACQPFTQRFVDYVTGWYADIKIITEFDNSSCDNPWI